MSLIRPLNWPIGPQIHGRHRRGGDGRHGGHRGRRCGFISVGIPEQASLAVGARPFPDLTRTQFVAVLQDATATRHDAVVLRLWLNRIGTVMPKLRFDVKNAWVKDFSQRMTVQWVGTATLINGDQFINPGVKSSPRSGARSNSLDVSGHFQAVAAGLAKQPKRESRRPRLPRSNADSGLAAKARRAKAP